MTGTILVYGATGTQGTPVEDQLLKQGKDTRVVTRDAGHAAHELATYEWDVADPRGVVQVAHGLAEHSARYDRFARALNDAGYVVRARRTLLARRNRAGLGSGGQRSVPTLDG